VIRRGEAGKIGFGRPGATRPEIRAAARRRMAAEFLMPLPPRLQLPSRREGRAHLGRQRQSLRSPAPFLRDPAILLLDERRGALDAESEHAVQRALAALSGARTRLSSPIAGGTVRRADRIKSIMLSVLVRSLQPLDHHSSTPPERGNVKRSKIDGGASTF